MNRAWYPPLVILFWMLSTGWLVVEKILPAWKPGSPPGSQALHLADGRPLPVAWTVLLDDRPAGWSISRASLRDGGAMLVESLLHLDELPVGELLPPWTRLLLGGTLPAPESITLEAQGRMEVDAAGRLVSFTSAVEFPGEARILLSGTVDGGEVAIVVRAGEMRWETKRSIPEGLALGDELAPNATLPGLRPGRRWTVPVYGPLRPGGAPMEILHAEVGEPTMILHDGRAVEVDVVSLRDDPSSSREPRVRLSVDRTGRVLRQEATTMGKRLVFERRSDADAERLAHSIAPPEPAGTVGEGSP